ncbi:hypothetical protein [Dyella dinghuensis]|nr:hypothetical protein [Dyella dinghuensis]
MSRTGAWIGACLLGLVLSGCGHQAPGSSGKSDVPSSPSTTAAPARPTAAADESTWGNYLAEQGKRHADGVSQHPYIYVIPRGDGVGATDRRKNELDSIDHSIGPILMPGGMLILGGPDVQQTTAFITELSKTAKADALKGIVVLVVTEPSQTDGVKSALKPTGATVRVATM